MAYTVGVFDWPGGAQRLLAEVDEDGEPGRPVILRGFDVSGAAKTCGTPFAGVAGLDVVRLADWFLPELRDDGFDLLRVPIVWEFLQTNGAGDWSEGIAAALRAFVAHAGSLGFQVIIDVHQDVMSSYFRHATEREWRGDGLPEWLLRLAVEDETSLSPDWVDTILGVRQWAINYNSNGAMRRAMTGLIVLAGVATSMGVDSTARAANERAYNVTFASDAMTDLDPAWHELILKKFFPRIGEIDTTDALLG